MLLPADIKSYRPYVEGESLSSPASVAQLSEKLDEWFRKAMLDLQTSVTKWFSDLKTVHEVWGARSRIRLSVEKTQSFYEKEQSSIGKLLDAVCLSQATAVWKSELQLAENTFRDLTDEALSTLKGSSVSDPPGE